jgi:hypothetical protein
MGDGTAREESEIMVYMCTGWRGEGKRAGKSHGEDDGGFEEWGRVDGIP